VDQHGAVLDILVQGRRNATAAQGFFRRLLAGLKDKPKHIVTDGLRSYGAAKRGVQPDVRHRTSRYLNNAPRTPIARPGAGSVRCSGSSHPAKPSGSCHPTPSSTATLVRAGT
jgi:hypothetical protein